MSSFEREVGGWRLEVGSWRLEILICGKSESFSCDNNDLSHLGMMKELDIEIEIEKRRDIHLIIRKCM